MTYKKAQADPFNLGARIGYYVMVLLFVIILFFFVALLANGITTKLYKNNYGANAMNLEERAFRCIGYTDPVTDIFYPKIIDYTRLLPADESRPSSFNADILKEFNDCMGIESKYDYYGFKFILRDVQAIKILSVETLNYVDRADFYKEYPIFYYDLNNELQVGEINISFWKI